MTDTISLRGIEVLAYHGAFPEEAVGGQIFLVDVTIEADLARPGDTDRLADTIDYAALTASIHDRVQCERWDLIERVARRVADLVLEHPLVEAVEVTIHKPSAPMPQRLADVTVSIRRTR